MGFTVKGDNKRVSASCGCLRDDASVDMDTKVAYTFTSRALNLVSFYMLRVRNNSKLCNREPTVYKVSG